MGLWASDTPAVALAFDPETPSLDSGASHGTGNHSMRATPDVALTFDLETTSPDNGASHGTGNHSMRTTPAVALTFDLETTSLDIWTCEIVQIAIVVASSDGFACWEANVLPETKCWFDPAAVRIHKLSREILVETGARPFAVVWAECEKWLMDTLGSRCPLVWAAHACQTFDRPILERCVRRATGRLPSVLSPPRASFIDTLKLARCAGMFPCSLGALHIKATGTELEDAHNALADARGLAVGWRWLVERLAANQAPGITLPLGPGSFQAYLEEATVEQATLAHLGGTWLEPLELIDVNGKDFYLHLLEHRLCGLA